MAIQAVCRVMALKIPTFSLVGQITIYARLRQFSARLIDGSCLSRYPILRFTLYLLLFYLKKLPIALDPDEIPPPMFSGLKRMGSGYSASLTSL
jgi:hypothetical protein